MHFLQPLLLLLGIVALLGHLLAYFLRARHPPRPVSSLMLWRQATHVSDRGRSLRRLHLPPLFFLELLALVALALAAATPFLRRGGAPALTVVHDPSLSMTALAPSGRPVRDLAADALRRELRRDPPPFVRLIAADPAAPRLVGLVSPSDALAYLRDPAHFAAPSDSLPGALALADRLRAPGTPILCLSDHTLSEDQLPSSSRLLAFGSSRPNASIAFARRSLAESGDDSLLVEVRTYPESVPPSLSLKTQEQVVLHTWGESSPHVWRTTLPPGTGPITLSLPDDPLAADNAVTLLPPAADPVPVTVDVADAALSNLVVRALLATGLATLSPTSSPLLLITDRYLPSTFNSSIQPSILQPPTLLHLSKPLGSPRLSSAPPLVEPGIPLLEGLDFSGLAWTLGDAPLPGRPLVSSGITPILTLETISNPSNPENHLTLQPSTQPSTFNSSTKPSTFNLQPSTSLYHLLSSPTSPFFRSPAWPSLVWNLLHQIAEENATQPPQVHHGSAESDLTGAATATVTAPLADAASDATVSTLPTALLALLAFALLVYRLHLLRRSGVPRTRLHLVLPALSLALLLAALFRPALPLPRKSGMVVAIVDRSSSLPAAEREAQPALLESIARRRSPGESFGVVSFGADPALEALPSAAPFEGFSADLDPEGSDLDGALRLAAGLVPAGTPARFVLLSDGRVPTVTPPPACPPVDVRFQGAPPSAGPEFVRIDAPLRLRPDEGLLATAWVLSPTNTPAAAYRFRCGTNLVAAGTCDLPAGLVPLSFRDAPRPAGTATYTLTLASGENRERTARFLVTREAAKPLLAVPPAPGAAPLGGALAASGIPFETVSDPTLFDFSPANLSGYSGLLLENVPASALGPIALSNIVTWVSEAGGGLALTGGRNAFGQGGYYKSPLDPVLPVTLEIRNEKRKFSMAVAIALDRSGSMGAPAGGGRTKMDLADIGSAEVLDLLADADELAVFAVDSEPHTVVPLCTADKARKMRKKILGIRSEGGGIFVYRALSAAIEALKESKASIRHVLLFADACDAEQPEDYTTLVGLALDLGITVSVIGLGTPTDCDADLLRDIAAIGGGECFFSANADEIPRLFAQDTILLSRNAIVEEPTAPRFTTALPLFSDALPSGAPALGGYNLCYAHPAATVVALSSDDNAAPLLAFRPVGAGRTLAFTGEANGELSGPFAAWEHATEFYAALARMLASAGDADIPGLHVRPRLDDTAYVVDLYVDADRPLAEPPTLRVLRTRASGTVAETHAFAWTAADRLTLSLPLRASETILPILEFATQPTDRQTDRQTDRLTDRLLLPPACLPFSPELLPDPDNRGEATLASLSRATGGERLIDPADVWARLPRGTRPYAIAPILYLLASLLLLLDILHLRLGAKEGLQKVPEVSRSLQKVSEVHNGSQTFPKPTTPATSATPATPATSETPATPVTSATPATPATPATSETPATPATPETPETSAPSLLSQAKRRARQYSRDGH